MSNFSNYHATPIHNLLTLDERNLNEAVVEKKILFLNRTHKDICICERSNLKFLIPANPTFGMEQKIIIRIEYFFNTEKVKNNTALILDGLQNLSEHLRVYKDAFSCNLNRRVYGGIDFVVDYSVSLNEIEELGTSVYFKEIDTVISLNDLKICPDHPFSHEGEINKHNSISLNSHNSSMFNIDLSIVDPKHLYGGKYINVLGSVYKVNTTSSSFIKEGIYLTTIVNGKKTQRFFNFDSANKEIQLYRTYDEALTNGSADIILKKELALLENKNLLLKNEMEETKLDIQQKELVVTRKKAELDLEREELKAERERQDHVRKIAMEETKDHYEHRSYARKDSSDSLKILPTLLVGLGALFVGIKSIFT